jgi:Outer membrane protein beta-barrel domain
VSSRLVALSILAACSIPADAGAEWYVSPYVGARFGANTTFLFGREGTEQRTFTFGSSVGFLTAGVLGVEADVSFVPGFFTGTAIESSLVTTVMGNVVVATPLGVTQYGLRPYLVGGLGLLRARGDTNDIENVIGSNLFGMNIGGGALGPISPRSSVRFDVRYFRNLGGDEDATTFNNAAEVELSFWRGTVGLTVRF